MPRWTQAAERLPGMTGPDIAPHALQDDDWSCGPCALAAGAARLGVWAEPTTWAARLGTGPSGTSATVICSVARRHGLTASIRRRVGIERLRDILRSRAVIGYIHGSDHWVSIPWVHQDMSIVGVLDPLRETPYPLPWDGGGDRLLDGYAIVLGRR